MNLRKDYLKGEPVHTIYFGGGTPSLLSMEEIGRILEEAFKLFNCCPEEITLEANPDDLSPYYIRSLRKLPVNRLSIGIQSFSDVDLKRMNRRHTSSQAINAVKTCQDAGLDNISIDLIYGLPDQTLEQWEKNLQMAIDLQMPHISAYHLSYEKGTEFFRQWQQGKISPTEETLSETMFRMLRNRLKEAGFQPYEISNFAKPGMESKHNSSYWNDVPYIGLGPSAHSYDRVSRQWNVSDAIIYLEALEKGNPFYEREELDEKTRYNDFIITSLRTMKGIDILLMKKKFGEKLPAYCLQNAATYVNNNLLELKDNNLRLTEESLFISDGIMSELLWVD
jgi:oxygen-independent coproporphyrinogen-3 oxidase